MQLKYFVKNGEFFENKNEIIFKGRKVENVNPLTGEINSVNMYGDILFADTLKSGKISFDIIFENLNLDSRCGIMFDYKNTDGIETFYQVGIRNNFASYSFDYYNGKDWEFRGYGGTKNTLKKNKKYNISLEIKGNILKFMLNGVLVYTYTKFVSNSSICGLYVSNNANTKISNIKINTEKATIFSIMKFEKDFDELYADVIVPKCSEFGYKAIRADECYTTTAILDDIIKEISDATIVIADVTMDNPNVFYELGYAHALKKPTILLADIDKRERLPFDVSGYRTIFYNNSIGGKKDIEKTLEKYLENINMNNA